MSIVKKQLERLIEDASITSLKSGRVLDLSVIIRLIKEKLTKLNGGPTLQVYKQNKRSKLNLESLNEMFKNTEFDLNICYDLLQEDFADLLNKFNSIDISYKSQRSSLRLIEAITDSLLFSVNNADDNFYSISDSYDSLSKVDVSKTDKNSIDLTEGCAIIPYSLPSATRLDMSHLYLLNEGNIEVQGNNIVSASNGAGSKFGYAFSDANVSWRYEVTKDSDDGVTITIKFPINKDITTSIISRLEFSSYLSNGMTAEIRSSVDNVNYTRLPTTSPKLVLSNTEKISWDFPDTTVRYISLILTKSKADIKTAGNTIVTNPILANPSIAGTEHWLYAFVINYISIYKLGRSQDAFIYSKPLKPTDVDDSPIRMVSLEVNEEILPDTDIRYDIALCDSTGNLVSEYIQINPINRLDSIVPKTITFSNTSENSIYLKTGNLSSSFEYKGLDFYNLLDTDEDYIYNSVKIDRGAGLFSRSINPKQINKSIKDNYIDFSGFNPTKSLYYFNTENALPINRLISVNGEYKTYLKLSNSIVESVKVARASSDAPVSVDNNPDYAIASVKHNRPIMTIENLSIAPNTTNNIVNGVQIPVASTWLGSTVGAPSIGVPIIYNGMAVDIVQSSVELRYISSNGSFIHLFRKDIDYSIKRSDDPYFLNFPGWNPYPLHWRIIPVEPSAINVQSGSVLTGVFGGTGQFQISQTQLPPVTLGSISLSSSETLKITFDIDADITHRVVDISYTDNEIELDGFLQIMPGDSVVVEYKTIPSNIIRESVNVTSNYGDANEGIVFLEGTDYILDLVNGKITAIIGGSIMSQNLPKVYVDFSFKYDVPSTEKFSVWCFYGKKDPYKFVYNPLSLRTVEGESFYWSYTNGNDVITKRIDDKKEIVFTYGWHHFTVNSLNPETYNDAAINKILKLKDINSKYLFISADKGGEVITTMKPFREPLQRVSLSFLKNSVLKIDHTKFALSDNNIYINFNPGYTNDLYYVQVNTSGNLITELKEEFYLTGLVKLDNDNNPGYIILRTILNRNKGSSGGITPKLHGYNLRIGY